MGMGVQVCTEYVIRFIIHTYSTTFIECIYALIVFLDIDLRQVKMGMGVQACTEINAKK